MFLEALTSREIIDVSKKWQAKVVSADNFSPRELYDLASDVIKIRATFGLISRSRLGNNLVADLSHNMVNILLVSALGNSNEQYVDIVVKQEGNNTQDLSEGYYLEKEPDHFGNFTGTASWKKDLVSIRHSASFQSPLQEGIKEGFYKKVFIKGAPKYEDEKFSFMDINLMTVTARAIWASHLENGAPLKNEYLPPVTPAAL